MSITSQAEKEGACYVNTALFLRWDASLPPLSRLRPG